MRIFRPGPDPGRGRAGQGNQTVFVVILVMAVSVLETEGMRAAPAVRPTVPSETGAKMTRSTRNSPSFANAFTRFIQGVNSSAEQQAHFLSNRNVRQYFKLTVLPHTKDYCTNLSFQFIMQM